MPHPPAPPGSPARARTRPRVVADLVASRGRAVLRDVVPVVGLVVVDVLLWREARDVPPSSTALPALGLPLLVVLGRHHRPVPSFIVATCSAVAAFALVPSSGEVAIATTLALVLCLVTVVDHASRRVALGAVAVCGLASATTLLVPPPSSGRSLPTLAAVTVAAVLLGRNRRARRTELTLLRERAETAERTRDALARTAVAEERRRIAREVHDIVSHNIAVMTNLADGAAVAMRRDRPAAQAVAAVEAIAGTGREAMQEMHALLGVLREPDEREEAPRLPAPGMEQLPDLVAQVRTAGLAASLVSEGEPRPVGSGTGLTIYRLVQESLSNTLRHARGAHSAVATLRWSAEQVVVDVVDDGEPGGAERHTEGGHGLIGMRERVHAHGGRLRTGPDPVTGWRVTAHLPLTTTPENRG